MDGQWAIHFVEIKYLLCCECIGKLRVKNLKTVEFISENLVTVQKWEQHFREDRCAGWWEVWKL